MAIDPSPALLRAAEALFLEQPVRVFSERTFAQKSKALGAGAAKPRRLLEALVQRRSVRVLQLHSETGAAPRIRYALPGATDFEIALSLHTSAYLCHASAAFLHGLTDEVPQTFYVNVEQSEKTAPEGQLYQDAVDRAFRNEQRSSRCAFVLDSRRFVQLAGKRCGRHGVLDVLVEPQNSSRAVPCTGLERTLVDLVVRPGYGGGVQRVISAFTACRDRTSVSRLLACLRALDYRYPYHQALGFYLERAGFAATHLDRLRAMSRPVKFYLTYGMREPEFDAGWDVYHPRGT